MLWFKAFSLAALSNALLLQQVSKLDDSILLTSGPTKEEGASVARTLVHRESLVNVNTIKTVKSSDGSALRIPVSSMEYYADCDEDGDPYWLVIDIGGPNQDIIKGSPFSFSIRDGDHPEWDKVAENYPGKREGSNAGSPRVQLFGRLEYVNFYNPFDPKKLKLEKCFLERHPDAALWLPDIVISPHKSHWTKIKVESIHIIGGFGDTAYIGTIDSEEYHSAEIIEPPTDEEGRGL
ncbi:uncharacterized protein LODBEIA_P17810 [Lodderomyces beijingensis]|uniref:CREG-like beta-barrel domain-containing protein n=1 Tax=Lodderomyces beijingensis TaxID=1775926 RepID=A0ABP0ZHA9_9ASCO